MLTEREFGKLSPEQFGRLVKAVPEVRELGPGLAKALRENVSKLDEFLGASEKSWAARYEMPFFEQMAHLMILVGLHEPLLAAWETEDPLEEYSTWGEEGSRLDQWYAEHDSSLNAKHLIWLTVVFQRNILAIMLFHCSMGHLIERTRNGDDDLRYSIVALRSLGFDRFTDQDLERLFIKTRLYPNSAGALKNLRKHIQAARKLQPPDLVNSGGRAVNS